MVDGFACGLQIAFSGSGYPVYGKVGVCHFESSKAESFPIPGNDGFRTRHPSFRKHGRQVYGSAAQALLAKPGELF